MVITCNLVIHDIINANTRPTASLVSLYDISYLVMHTPVRDNLAPSNLKH